MYELVSFYTRTNPQQAGTKVGGGPAPPVVVAGSSGLDSGAGQAPDVDGLRAGYLRTKRTTISMMLSRREISAAGVSRSRWKMSENVCRLATLNTLKALIDM
jgi:hypothetical protein